MTDLVFDLQHRLALKYQAFSSSQLLCQSLNMILLFLTWLAKFFTITKMTLHIPYAGSIRFFSSAQQTVQHLEVLDSLNCRSTPNCWTRFLGNWLFNRPNSITFHSHVRHTPPWFLDQGSAHNFGCRYYHSSDSFDSHKSFAAFCNSGAFGWHSIFIRRICSWSATLSAARLLHFCLFTVSSSAAHSGAHQPYSTFHATLAHVGLQTLLQDITLSSS